MNIYLENIMAKTRKATGLNTAVLTDGARADNNDYLPAIEGASG
jgi:hypothetical protein